MVEMDLGLQDRVVLVTGAGAGIGQAIALAFADEGATVVVNDVVPERCSETLDLLREKDCRTLQAAFDITNRDAVEAGVSEVQARLGRLDVLVNNAAVMVNNLAFVDKRPEDCELEIAVSLFGTMHCTRAVLKGMAEHQHGRIINIVSDAARVGQEKEVAYSSAKGGVISFTKSLAREVGRNGITVNAVSPAAQAELAFATGPDMQYRYFYSGFEADDIVRMIELNFSGRLKLYDGPFTFAPGIEMRTACRAPAGRGGGDESYRERLGT